MQPKPPDVRQSLSLKQTLPHVWPPGDGVGAGAGFDGLTKFHWAVLGRPYLELHSVRQLPAFAGGRAARRDRVQQHHITTPTETPPPPFHACATP